MISLEQLTEGIEEIKLESYSTNYLIHVWLEGFRNLIENVRLSKRIADEYLSRRLKEMPSFTILQSSSYCFTYPGQMLSGELSIKQLPINDKYHLQFPLILDKNEYTFMLTHCTICKKDNIHKLPLIELRTSITLSKESFEKGTIMYDNRINPRKVNKEGILASYQTVQNFVERCIF